MKSRIMYIERKTGNPEAWIGRVTFSQTGRTLYYRTMQLVPSKQCIYGNHYDRNEPSQEYWVSGPKKNGQDRLFGRTPVINIDEDVREEYWAEIRNLPEQVDQVSY